MNARSPYIRLAETNASTLESFGGQKHKTETYDRARELRRWINANPDKESSDMPEGLRGYLHFLVCKKLVTWRCVEGRRLYFVRKI